MCIYIKGISITLNVTINIKFSFRCSRSIKFNILSYY